MRKEVNVAVPPDYERDAGKIFHIKEMPAIKAEAWAWRLKLALKGTDGFVHYEVVDQLGMVGVAIATLNAILKAPVRYEDLQPLLDEMLECVQMVRDPKFPEVYTPLKPMMDFEEVRTIYWLRDKIVELHTNFSLAAALSSLASAINTLGSQTTPTSPGP